MKSNLILLPILALLASACGGQATPAANANVPVVVDQLTVVATGRLLPAQNVGLSFAAGGQVARLLVTEGQVVAAGDLIAQLQSSDALRANVSTAQLNLLAAQQAVQDLNDSAAMATAQAAFAVAQATDALTQTSKTLRNIQNPVSDRLVTVVSDTALALQTAQNNNLLGTVSPDNQALVQATAQVNVLFSQYQNLQAKWNAGDHSDTLYRALQAAQSAYQSALDTQSQLKLRIQTDQANQGDAVTKAQKAYNDAVANLDAARRGPDAGRLILAEANLSLAQATLADAKRKYDKIKAGPDPDQLRLAQAKVDAAQTALASAQAALADSELHAPFAGTVAHLAVKVSQQVTPGEIVGTLADFSSWTVETSNLTEIEVVRIRAGQGVTVTLDALPNVPLRGSVTAISPVFEEKQGDITYTTRVSLADRQPQMRWGMTAQVTFAK
jgi:multidrug efflux pump subunit AcrA (membrane-fusion protein)